MFNASAELYIEMHFSKPPDTTSKRLSIPMHAWLRPIAFAFLSF